MRNWKHLLRSDEEKQEEREENLNYSINNVINLKYKINLFENQLYKPLRDSIFSFLAFCTSSVILVMIKFCARNSRMDSIKASRPRGFSARMSNNIAVLFVCVVLQLISSASSRVRILRERR